jgi:hypothetical protein
MELLLLVLVVVLLLLLVLVVVVVNVEEEVGVVGSKGGGGVREDEAVLDAAVLRCFDFVVVIVVVVGVDKKVAESGDVICGDRELREVVEVVVLEGMVNDGGSVKVAVLALDFRFLVPVVTAAVVVLGWIAMIVLVLVVVIAVVVVVEGVFNVGIKPGGMVVCMKAGGWCNCCCCCCCCRMLPTPSCPPMTPGIGIEFAFG